ncbi:hypothetical protein [Aeromicrobium sp. Leaf272]|uniref:hypothetical protein n=1 Tax=Aeromicrobium sp. Leaf272 TaxID=1736317 RepID=UPI0012E28612|nr:hypothetical protein [Aeromicrobium sp. Leaf272]
MARYKGNTTPQITFVRAAATAIPSTDLGAFATKIEFTEGDGEPVTFSDVADGKRPVAVELEFATDFGPGTAFNFLQQYAGSTGVSYDIRPLGSTALSSSAPKFSGTCTLPASPLINFEKGTEVGVFSVTIQLDTYAVSYA